MFPKEPDSEDEEEETEPVSADDTETGSDPPSQNGTEPSNEPEPLEERYPEATTDIQLEYAEVVDENYAEHSDYYREFISDEELDEDFIDAQLELLMEEASDQWQEDILVTRALDQDDWTRNGRAHVKPDGSEGPAYDNPFTLRSAPDAFVLGYFNSTGNVYDPRTGEYLGFQPDETFGEGPDGDLVHYGDKVGLKGDRNGNGSIAEFLDGVEPEDLDPNEMHTVMAYNRPEEGEPGDETFEMMEDMMEEDVPPEVFREVMENTPNRTNTENIPPRVNMHTIDLGTVEIDQTYNPGEEWAQVIYQENMPRELRGPVNYTLYVPDIEGNIGGTVLDFADRPDHPFHDIGNAGIVEPFSNIAGVSPSAGTWHYTAGTSFQETYWHGVGGHMNSEANPREPPEGTPTLTTDWYEGKPLRFLDREWRDVLTGMNVRNRFYYRTPFHRERSYYHEGFDK
jgi:hypothetical protein